MKDNLPESRGCIQRNARLEDVGTHAKSGQLTGYTRRNEGAPYNGTPRTRDTENSRKTKGRITQTRGYIVKEKIQEPTGNSW